MGTFAFRQGFELPKMGIGLPKLGTLPIRECLRGVIVLVVRCCKLLEHAPYPETARTNMCEAETLPSERPLRD